MDNYGIKNYWQYRMSLMVAKAMFVDQYSTIVLQVIEENSCDINKQTCVIRNIHQRLMIVYES